MRSPLPGVPDDVWTWLCEARSVRPEAVAAGRARLAVGDWPSALAIADAILGVRLPQAA